MNQSITCSNATKELDSPLLLLDLLVYIPLFFFGILCNGLALWVFCCKMRNWKVTVIYMVNLIISDMLVLLTFPFRLYAFMHSWDLGDTLCKSLVSLYYLNTYMSIYTITAIAFDRYLAVKFPLKSRRWRSPVTATVVCCVMWTLLISFDVFFSLHIRSYEFPLCFRRSDYQPNYFFLVLVVAGFVFPLLIMSFCAGQVLLVLCSKETNDISEYKSTRKAINIIISNLVIFIVCFLPLHMVYTIRLVAESVEATCYIQEQIKIFINVAILLSNTNCVLDSLSYYFAASEFWSAFPLFSKLRYNKGPVMPKK